MIIARPLLPVARLPRLPSIRIVGVPDACHDDIQHSPLQNLLVFLGLSDTGSPRLVIRCRIAFMYKLVQYKVALRVAAAGGPVPRLEDESARPRAVEADNTLALAGVRSGVRQITNPLSSHHRLCPNNDTISTDFPDFHLVKRQWHQRTRKSMLKAPRPSRRSASCSFESVRAGTGVLPMTDALLPTGYRIALTKPLCR